MTLYLRDAALDVFEPTNDSDVPDERIRSGVGGEAQAPLRQVDVTARIGDTKDKAEITIDNAYGAYTGRISSGSKVVFASSTRERIASLQGGQFDRSQYGGAQYGGGEAPLQRRWTGLVRGPVKYDRNAGSREHQTLSVPAVDWVAGILSDRIVYDEFEGVPISTVVDTIVANNAPEIDRSGIEQFDATTDILPQGANLLDTVAELADQADAVFTSVGETLVFRDPTTIERSFDVRSHTDEPDIGLWSAREVDDELVNDIRVDGGTGRDLESEQTVVDGYHTVTESDYETFRIDMRKSAVDMLEIWTRADRDGEDMTLRLQRDAGDGSGPIEPGDEDSDIDAATLDANFLANDSFTSFIFNDHTLPEPDPWVIVQTEGTTGQEIGVDTSTTPDSPAYRAHYPYPISVRLQDRQSIANYGRVQGRIKRKTISTFDAAEAVAKSVLRHYATPNVEFQADAQSRRMHAQRLANVVGLEFPDVGAVGDYIITETRDVFGPSSSKRNQLETTLTAREIATI